jgi:hypothetical protein
VILLSGEVLSIGPKQMYVCTNEHCAHMDWERPANPTHHRSLLG